MIVDLHTHLIDYDTETGPEFKADLARCGIPADTWKFTPEDYLKGVEAADRAVVFGIRAKKTGWHTDNARVAAFAREHEKLVFYASVDPLDEDMEAQLTYCHQSLGCAGVKLGPVYQGVHPHDGRYRTVYAYCERHGLPVITHMATTFSSGVPLDYARPVLMDQIACEYPRLKIVLAHLGHPWEAECIAAIRHQPNLYADVAALYYRPWQFYNAMRLLTEYGAGGKVFFGSDFPATTTRSSLDGLRAMNGIAGKAGLPPVPETLIEEIIGRDPFDALY